MNRRAFLAAAGLGVTRVGLGASIDSSVAATTDQIADRVVRLRYLGQDGATLGLAPVSGLLLGEAWVLTSGYGLTTDPAAILCQLTDRKETRGRLVARDESRRLALIRLVGESDTPPVITGRPARVGETAVALGRVYRSEKVNLSVGVVSAVSRFGGQAIQTDAAISPVNYGGPLVGLDGALLGVVTPLSPPGQEGVNLYDSGVGFAVPVAAIAERLPRLAGGETIRPGWMGLATPGDDPLRRPPRLESVIEGGPAERAGLKPGDVILDLNGRPTPTVWALRAVARGLDADQTIGGRVQRETGQEDTFRITLGLRPEKSSDPEPSLTKKPGELD